MGGRGKGGVGGLRPPAAWPTHVGRMRGSTWQRGKAGSVVLPSPALLCRSEAKPCPASTEHGTATHWHIRIKTCLAPASVLAQKLQVMARRWPLPSGNQVPWWGAWRQAWPAQQQGHGRGMDRKAQAVCACPLRSCYLGWPFTGWAVRFLDSSATPFRQALQAGCPPPSGPHTLPAKSSGGSATWRRASGRIDGMRVCTRCSLSVVPAWPHPTAGYSRPGRPAQQILKFLR